MKKFDVIIIGLGAYGSALSLSFAKAGVSVLGIDMYNPPHTFGSSHGDSRIARLANGEGDVYTKLALRSRNILRQIEKRFKTKLMQKTGGLIISSPHVTEINHVSNMFENTIKIAKKYSINHQILSADQIKEKYGVFNLKGNEKGYFERQSAIYFPEKCIKYNFIYARELGSVHRVNEKVLEIKEQADEVIIVTDKDKYLAKKVYLTAGSWNNYFLKNELNLKNYIKIYKQKLFWFKIAPKFIQKYRSGKLPFFVWELPGKLKAVYGFPSLNNNSIKIATEQYDQEVNPNKKPIEGNLDNNKFYKNYIFPNLVGINSKILKTANCMYSVTPDNMFLVKKVGKYNNITLVSCCSGHGFKHSYAICEALVQIYLNKKSTIDISSFQKIKRL